MRAVVRDPIAELAGLPVANWRNDKLVDYCKDHGMHTGRDNAPVCRRPLIDALTSQGACYWAADYDSTLACGSFDKWDASHDRVVRQRLFARADFRPARRCLLCVGERASAMLISAAVEWWGGMDWAAAAMLSRPMAAGAAPQVTVRARS